MWRHSPRRRDIENLLVHADALRLSRAAKNRLHWFAFALAHGENVSLTCRYFGISRSTFDRLASRFDPRNPETLEENSRRPHHVRTPQTPSPVVALVRQYRLEQPTLGKDQIASVLRSNHNITISASTVGRIIARGKFFFAATESHARKLRPTDYTVSVHKHSPSPVSSDSRAEPGEAGLSLAPDLPALGS